MIEKRPMTPAELAARYAPAPAQNASRGIAAHMGRHIREIAEVNEGVCLDSDLVQRGFTLGELRHHGVEAAQIAAQATLSGRA